MSNYVDYDNRAVVAVIIADQDPEWPFGDDMYATTAQLVRATKYCQDKGLMVRRVFVLDGENLNKPFYKAVDFIKKSECKIAVVADTADQLLLYDFNKSMIWDYWYYKSKIEIHLVKENIALCEPYDKTDEKTWTKINHIHPDYRDGIRKGIDVIKEITMERNKTLTETKEEN